MKKEQGKGGNCSQSARQGKFQAYLEIQLARQDKTKQDKTSQAKPT